MIRFGPLTTTNWSVVLPHRFDWLAGEWVKQSPVQQLGASMLAHPFDGDESLAESGGHWPHFRTCLPFFA